MTDNVQHLPPLVRAMSEPELYPDRPRSVELRQTHISYVFLTDTTVYKIKKPVRLSFLDYSTLDLRLHYCREELRLNRRLAPKVYLGIVAIRSSNGGLVLDEDMDPRRPGRIIEYAVKMRRLKDQDLLDRLVPDGRAGPAEIRAVARRIARFHAAAPSQRARELGGPDPIWERVANNFKETAAFTSITHSREDREFLWRYSADTFATRKALFEARVEEGRVREGHGDLRAEHICVSPDGAISIFDCVEFSESLRTCDGVSEIAFLAMDLDFLGAGALARELVATYAEETDDRQLYELLPFYATYRALVRGKVEGMKSAEVEIPFQEREAARARAQRYFDLAYRYARGERSPAILVTCGMAGTGKSSVARRLSDRTGFPAFNSDVIRKQLAGIEPTTRARGEFARKIYSQSSTEDTYRTLRARAEETLASRQGVIIDATFGNPTHRRLLMALAEARNVPILFIECTASEQEVRRRLEAREQRPGEVSDATLEVYERQRRDFTPFTELANFQYLPVRTEEPVDRALHDIDDLLDRSRTA